MGTNPIPVAQDTWGALGIPTQPGYSFTPIAQEQWVEPAEIISADVCLAVILDYLATAINIDKIVQQAWNQKQSLADDQPLKRIFCHSPKDSVFSVEYLPALFLWREMGDAKYAADEWLRVTTKVKGLWVFPLSSQNLLRAREPFANALFDGISNTIERGRTPSWVQPTDTEARAATEGSVFYPFAGFESFIASHWQRSRLDVQVPNSPKVASYPAIEFTFDLEENQIRGIARFAPLAGVTATLYDASGSTVWAGNVAYSLNALVFPTGGNGYVYQCTTAGITANTPPTNWPTVIGQTVQDGSVVWTCSATMSPNGNPTDSGPL